MVLTITQEEKVHIVRHDELIPKSFDYFYDHIHFNELGTRSFARNIAEFIIQNDINIEKKAKGPETRD